MPISRASAMKTTYSAGPRNATAEKTIRLHGNTSLTKRLVTKISMNTVDGATHPITGRSGFPRTTVVGWAPYRYGHWAYIAPWGYTWVDDEPWALQPFHYGRWVTVGRFMGLGAVPAGSGGRGVCAARLCTSACSLGGWASCGDRYCGGWRFLRGMVPAGSA